MAGTKQPARQDIAIFLSWLRGKFKQVDKEHITFPKRADWYIKCWDKGVIQELKDGIEDDSSVIHGMKVYKKSIKPTPNFGSVFRFEVDSPVVNQDEQR